VPRKKDQGRGRPVVGTQVNVRLSDDLLADLRWIAESFDADLSHVIRAILAEFAPVHMDRAREIRANRERARKAKGSE
jgi:predicted transcriptional regulator